MSDKSEQLKKLIEADCAKGSPCHRAPNCQGSHGRDDYGIPDSTGHPTIMAILISVGL
jgi:hypothetical protein